MGTGVYKGGTFYHHSISENLPNLTPRYTLTNGYFGIRGDSTREKIRHIESKDPIFTSNDFYNKLTHGATEKKMSNGKGTIAKLADGTIVSYRKVSSSDGTPAVDINIKNSKESGGVKQQKIHFVKEEKDKND